MSQNKVHDQAGSLRLSLRSEQAMASIAGVSSLPRGGEHTRQLTEPTRLFSETAEHIWSPGSLQQLPACCEGTVRWGDGIFDFLRLKAMGDFLAR